jgi:hypothetical protein
MVDAVSKGDHGGLGQTPAEAPCNYRNKGFSKQTFELGFLLRIVNPGVFLSISVGFQALEYNLPFFLELISVVFDVLLKYLILELFNLIRCPKHGYVAWVDNLHVWIPKGLFSLKEFMKHERGEHQVLRVVMLLEDFWML